MVYYCCDLIVTVTGLCVHFWHVFCVSVSGLVGCQRCWATHCADDLIRPTTPGTHFVLPHIYPCVFSHFLSDRCCACPGFSSAHYSQFCSCYPWSLLFLDFSLTTGRQSASPDHCSLILGLWMFNKHHI